MKGGMVKYYPPSFVEPSWWSWIQKQVKEAESMDDESTCEKCEGDGDIWLEDECRLVACPSCGKSRAEKYSRKQAAALYRFSDDALVDCDDDAYREEYF